MNYLDAGVVAALLLLNAVLSFVQDIRAGKAVDALKRRLQIMARVLRSEHDADALSALVLIFGSFFAAVAFSVDCFGCFDVSRLTWRRSSVWTNVTARELVPGDVIRLRTGDIVPADVKVLSGRCQVDQSALTGM